MGRTATSTGFDSDRDQSAPTCAGLVDPQRSPGDRRQARETLRGALATGRTAEPRRMSSSIRSRSPIEIAAAAEVRRSCASGDERIAAAPQPSAAQPWRMTVCAAVASANQDPERPSRTWFQCRSVVGVADQRVRRLVEVDARLLELPPEGLGPGLVGRERILVGDPLGLAVGRLDAQVMRQLADGRRPGRRGSRRSAGSARRAARPESVVGQHLVDHPLAEQLLEGQPALVHQREHHVADVAIGVDGDGPALGRSRGRSTGRRRAT